MVIDMLTRARIDRPQAVPNDEPKEKRMRRALNPRLQCMCAPEWIRKRALLHADNRLRVGDDVWRAARAGEQYAAYLMSQSEEPQPPSAA